MNSLTSNTFIQTPKGTPRFIRLDSKHHCQVCKGVVRDAMQTSCGHRICQSCIDTLFKDSSGPVMCPANEEDCETQLRDHVSLLKTYLLINVLTSKIRKVFTWSVSVDYLPMSKTEGKQLFIHVLSYVNVFSLKRHIVIIIFLILFIIILSKAV